MDPRWYELRTIIRTWFPVELYAAKEAMRLIRELEAKSYEKLQEEVRKNGT